MLYLYLYSFCNLLYRSDVFTFSLVVSNCSAFVKPLQVDVQSVNIVSTEIGKQFVGEKMNTPIKSQTLQVDVESVSSIQPAPTSFSGITTPLASQSPGIILENISESSKDVSLIIEDRSTSLKIESNHMKQAA